MFDARPCVRRTALGACAEQGTGTALAPAAPAGPANGGLRIIDATASRSAGGDADESDYIRMLRKRSEENAEQNAAFVREKTLANGMGGAFGPFSKSAAVMRADGSIMILPVGKYERLKDRGFIVVAPSGAGCLKKLRNGSTRTTAHLPAYLWEGRSVASGREATWWQHGGSCLWANVVAAGARPFFVGTKEVGDQAAAPPVA